MKNRFSTVMVMMLLIAFLYTGKFVLNDRQKPEQIMPIESPIVLETTTVVQTTMTTDPLPFVSNSVIVQTTFVRTTNATTMTVVSVSVTETSIASTESIVERTLPVTSLTILHQTKVQTALPPPVISVTVPTVVHPQKTEPVRTTAAPVVTTKKTTVLTTATPVQTSPPVPSGFVAAPDGYFNDALFIGDSRTVGMRDYAPISGADYFASVGMSVYNIKKQSCPVKGRGNLNFQSAITGKKYGKVYIMLGINELGYDRKKTIDTYKGIINEIRSAQPNALIYIEANLHVAAGRNNTDKIVNNANINAFNQQIAALADTKMLFYLDVNSIFDDANGNLRADYTHDNTHVLAKYYIPWREWLQGRVILK